MKENLAKKYCGHMAKEKNTRKVYFYMKVISSKATQVVLGQSTISILNIVQRGTRANIKKSTSTARGSITSNQAKN